MFPFILCCLNVHTLVLTRCFVITMHDENFILQKPFQIASNMPRCASSAGTAVAVLGPWSSPCWSSPCVGHNGAAAGVSCPPAVQTPRGQLPLQCALRTNGGDAHHCRRSAPLAGPFSVCVCVCAYVCVRVARGDWASHAAGTASVAPGRPVPTAGR